MKGFEKLACSLLLLALCSNGCQTPDHEQGHAIITTIAGAANCTLAGTQTTAMQGKELAAGTTVTTLTDSLVFLRINDPTSEIRIQPETTLTISKMDAEGTVLDLKGGSLLGHVKKPPGHLVYKIETPDGVAQITEAADFEIQTAQSSGGKLLTKFTCLKGAFTVSALVDGSLTRRTLRSRESLASGDKDPKPLLQSYQ